MMNNFINDKLFDLYECATFYNVKSTSKSINFAKIKKKLQRKEQQADNILICKAQNYN